MPDGTVVKPPGAGSNIGGGTSNHSARSSVGKVTVLVAATSWTSCGCSATSTHRNAMILILAAVVYTDKAPWGHHGDTPSLGKGHT